MMSSLQVGRDGSNWAADGGQLTENGEESNGEAHPQGWTEGPLAGSDGAEVMEKWGKDGKIL